jgi:NAD(P)-dependent dehydrogenase (short-subunit alcohol dehydrogenase family)
MRQYRVFRKLAIATLFLVAPLVATVSFAEAVSPSTVLTTGSNRGIGLGLVEGYAKAGWHVLATCRNPSTADALAALAKQYSRLQIERLDVTDTATIEALATKLSAQPIDVIINNAGITGNPPAQVLGNMDFDLYARVIAVNTIGPLLVAEAFLPHLRAGEQKKIMNISTSEGSFGVDRGPARIAFYRSSKSALNMLMLNYAKMAVNEGIAVGLVNPGPVDTDMMKNSRMPSLRSVDLTVSELVPIIENLNLENTGTFWNYDGNVLAW